MNTLGYEESIAQAQENFKNRLVETADETIEVKVSWPTETVLRTVYYNKKYDIWFYSKLRENRYRNVFGIGKPVKHSTVKIDCLIAIPIVGIDKKIAGGFAKDTKGNVYVFHRGKIGGGKKGIGKELFWRNYTGEWDYIYEGGSESKVAIITDLDAPDLIEKVSSFVHEVRRIKDVGSR